jgi:integrase
MPINGNPVRLISKPKENKPRDRRLEDGEEERLLLSCSPGKNPYLLPLVILAIETALRGLWSRACRRAEINDLHLHDLRHESTSRLFELGLNIMEVSAITGHKDLKMLKRYTHLKAEDLALKLG